MELIELVELYQDGAYNIDTFQNLILEHFHKLLEKKKFLELKYLKEYPFWGNLTDEDIYYDSAILDRELDNILLILNGRKQYIYDFWLGIETAGIEVIEDLWNIYKAAGKFSNKKEKLIRRLLRELRIHEIGDIYKVKLLRLLESLSLNQLNDSLHYEYDLLYVPNMKKDIILDEIQKLIDILQGRKPAHIALVYGNSQTEFIIV